MRAAETSNSLRSSKAGAFLACIALFMFLWVGDGLANKRTDDDALRAIAGINMSLKAMCGRSMSQMSVGWWSIHRSTMALKTMMLYAIAPMR